jgi:hypothetical protein
MDFVERIFNIPPGGTGVLELAIASGLLVATLPAVTVNLLLGHADVAAL